MVPGVGFIGPLPHPKSRLLVASAAQGCLEQRQPNRDRKLVCNLPHYSTRIKLPKLIPTARMDKTVGVLGGGQLDRMLQEAANRLNVHLITLDEEESPAIQINAVSTHINGSFTDPKAIHQLAAKCDILTIEIEHVDTDVLEDLSTGMQTREDWRLVKSTKVEVQPSWRTIRIVQVKYDQKEHLIKHEIPSARSLALHDHSASELREVAAEIGYPFMLKSRTEAYDGRGNFPVKQNTDIQPALEALRYRPLYAEQWVDFSLELAVMVVKIEIDVSANWQKATMAFPVVETVHEESICKLVYALRGVFQPQSSNKQGI